MGYPITSTVWLSRQKARLAGHAAAPRYELATNFGVATARPFPRPYLAPFGQDNPPPRLVSRGLTVRSSRRVGDGSHLKLELADASGAVRGAIGFRLGERDPGTGARIDVAFTPTVSTTNVSPSQRPTESPMGDGASFAGWEAFMRIRRTLAFWS